MSSRDLTKLVVFCAVKMATTVVHEDGHKCASLRGMDDQVKVPIAGDIFGSDQQPPERSPQFQALAAAFC